MFFKIKNKNIAGRERGQTVIEVLVAVSIFAALSTSAVFLILGGFESVRYGGDAEVASAFAQEGIDAARSIANQGWGELPVGGPYGISSASGFWELTGSGDVSGDFSRTVSISQVYRDGGGNIAPAGTLDPRTKKITAQVTWETVVGRPNLLNLISYFTLWVSRAWTETTTVDFADGTFTNTQPAAVGDGAVTLSGGSGGVYIDDEKAEFDLGIYSGTGWDNANNWLELTPGSAPFNAAGNFTSRTFDPGHSVPWTNIAWTPQRPIGKELPGNKGTETGYPSGNADMNGNVLLGHMNESSGTISDSSGDGNNGTSHNGVTYGASGKLNTALQFDGSNDYVSAASSASLNITGSITIEAWMNPTGGGWSYKKPVAVSNPGSLLTDYSVLAVVDTATLISAGKMQSDCDDIRFIDSDGTTLNYWIEAGCNSASTQIWVSIPSIPSGTKTIFMYYGNSSASAGGQSWAGSFVVLSSAACPSGWTRFSAMDGKFPQGNAAYGGTGGSATHTQTYSGTTGTPSATTSGRVYNSADASRTRPSTTHTHTYSGTTASADSTPPYLDMIFCSGANLIMPANLIVFFDNASLPANWTRFSALDGRFPRGNAAYGGTGGNATHTHTYSGTTGTPSATTSDRVYYSSDASRSWPSTTHTHTYSGTTGTANNAPPYLDMIFGRATAQTVGSSDLITMATALPPFGWTRFSALDGRFPRGNAAYGGTGGSATHTHTYSGTTGTPSATTAINMYYSGDASRTWPSTTHTQAYSGTTDSEDNIPPYLDMIFAKRNNPSATTSLGNETATGISKAGSYGLGAKTTAAYASINNQTISAAISAGWNHLVQTYDGSTQKLYVNGALAASQALSGAIGTNANELWIGDLIGFSGTIDEVAIYNRSLSLTEISDHYKRGVLTLKFQVRSGSGSPPSGSFVGPDGTAGTYYSELSNFTLGPPSIPLTNVSDNRYFQYKAYEESADTSFSPELKNITIAYGGAGYAVSGSYTSSVFDATTAASWNFVSWSETLPAGCDIRVQIRTAATFGEISSAEWAGPNGKDGNPADWFTDSAGEAIHPDHTGDEFIQYKVEFTGPGTDTGTMEDVSFEYQI